MRDSRKYERPHEKRRHLTTQSRDSLSHLPTISENPAVTQKGSSYSPQKKKDSVSDILYESSNKSTQTEASKNTSQIDGWRGTLSTFPKHRKLSIVVSLFQVAYQMMKINLQTKLFPLISFLISTLRQSILFTAMLLILLLSGGRSLKKGVSFEIKSWTRRMPHIRVVQAYREFKPLTNLIIGCSGVML